VTGPPVTIRRATHEDLPAILALGGRSLGWEPGAPTAAHFAWKHFDNPFGASPMWVAEAEGRLAGFRTFLRWEFETGSGERRRAVRAVDTATDPDFQGRGVFRALTLGALDELRAEGVDFVFNTPNAKSRPGYLKMGWQALGRLPVALRPTGPRALARLPRARRAADRGALACSIGEPAAEVLRDPGTAARLLAHRRRPRAHDALTTARSPEYLAWRYGPAPLHYRVVWSRDRSGAGVFHLRRRGAAIEAVICEVLVAGGARSAEYDILRRIARESGADYLLRLHTPAEPLARGFVPAPGLGPLLTTRAVSRPAVAERASWWLTLGDVELF